MPEPLVSRQEVRILVISDNEDDLCLLNQILGKHYKVLLARGGDEGLGVAQSIVPDLIILDLMMSGRGGNEAASKLTTMEQVRRIPILCVCSPEDNGSKVRVFEFGGADFVARPFQEQEILMRVRTQLSIRILSQQLDAELVERQRVEETLRQREHNFSSLVENATDMIVRFDTNLRHIYCNGAVERQLGIPTSAFLGKTFLDFSPITDEAIQSHQALQQALETDSGQEFERNYPTPFGMKFFHTRIIPEHAPDGRIESLLAITRDITERKRIEDAQRESEKRFQIIYKTEPECVKILNSDCTLVDMNPAGLAMIEAESLEMVRGQSVLQLVDAEFREKFKKLTEDVCTKGESGKLEFRITGLKGTPRWLETHAVPLFDSQGGITGLLGVTRDITGRKVIEHALQASEEKYRLLFDAASDAIFIHDENGNLLAANSLAVERLGYAREELMLMTIDQVASPDQSQYATERIERLMRQGNHTFETMHLRKDGTRIPTEVSARRIDWEGTPAMMSICRDITERKRVEGELRASNSKFETLIQVSPLAMTLLDADGIVRMWNLAAEEIFGWTAQEVIGHPNPIVQPAQKSEYEALSSQVVSGSSLTNFETIRQRKDGSLIDVSISSAPVRAADGTVIGRMAIVADISERKKMERSLLQRNQEMAKLYETSLEINSLADLSMLLKAIVRRACALLNIPSGALFLVRPKENKLELAVAYQLPSHWVGSKIQFGDGLAGKVAQTKEPLMVEDYQVWSAHLEAFNDSPARRSLGVPLKSKDEVIGVLVMIDRQVGSFSDEEVRLASLFAGQAAVAIINAQFAAQLEERVIQRTEEVMVAIKELESISYTVSHDLRSPLRAIVGYSRIIEDDYAVGIPPEGIQMLESIRASALGMGKMVDGLLSFMRLNRKALNVQPVDMEKLIRRVIDILDKEQADRQIEFVIHEISPCQGDPEMLFTVWYSLISNALKFTRLRDVACIEAGSMVDTDDQTIYYIKDNGVGFDMRYADKLFQVFYRLHHQEEFAGIGMGLALAQRVIFRHGGRIWSEASEGQGATFLFTLGRELETR